MLLCFMIRVRRIYDTGTLCLWYNNDVFVIGRCGRLWYRYVLFYDMGISRLWHRNVVFTIQERCVYNKEVWSFMIRVRRVYDTGTLCLWYRIGTPLVMDMYGWVRSQAALYIGIMMAVAGVLAVGVFVVVKTLSQRFDNSFYLMIFFLLPFGFLCSRAHKKKHTCSIACINICEHVKGPVVHVRVRWIMATQTYSGRTIATKLSAWWVWLLNRRKKNLSRTKPRNTYHQRLFLFFSAHLNMQVKGEHSHRCSYRNGPL